MGPGPLRLSLRWCYQTGRARASFRTTCCCWLADPRGVERGERGILCVDAEDARFWSAPLAELDAESAEHTLLVILITDDIAPEWASMGKKKRPVDHPACWCERVITSAVARIPRGFFHQSAPLAGQHWALGLPPILTGGAADTPPARAIVVVTDGHYRTLSAAVGVPTGEELTRLIGDAEFSEEGGPATASEVQLANASPIAFEHHSSPPNDDGERTWAPRAGRVVKQEGWMPIWSA